jgi:AbrB family looped-hinge helix DNA binding protein
MKLTTKGQVTIPLAVREHLGLLPHTEVEIYVRGDVAVIARAGSRRRGEALIEHMRGRGDVDMTTDEILALTRGTGESD